jgi:hypothetical protein
MKWIDAHEVLVRRFGGETQRLGVEPSLCTEQQWADHQWADCEGGDAQPACSEPFFSPVVRIAGPVSALMREVKNYLASWRLSADTAANAREKQGDRRTKP